MRLALLGILIVLAAVVSFVSLAGSSPIFYNPNLINCTKGLFGWWLTSCSINPVDLNLNLTGGNGSADYTNIAYQNQTNNFTQNNYMSNLNISGILYVGNNRSAFPITCSNNQFLSSLGSNGIFICTIPVIYNASYELMYNNSYELMYNVSYELMYNKTYEPVWTNVAFLNNSQNWTANQNFTQSIWIGRNLNVSGNSTLGNATIEYLNVSGQLFVGVNRSSFPITCSAGQFVSALATTGLFTCSTPATGSTDYTNVAFLNNTQTFTATNTFKDINITGRFTIINATVATFLNNVSSLGYINATGFNATGNSLLGNVNITGNLNVTGNISAGVVYSNNSQTLTYSEGMRLLCSNVSSSASAISSVDCLNLPAYTTYFVLLGFPTTQSTAQPALRFNNLGGTSYAWSICQGTSTTCTTGTSAALINLQSSAKTISGIASCWIYNFANQLNTTVSCSYVNSTGAVTTAPSTISVGGFWSQSAQITEISLLAQGVQFLPNTTIKVYGVI